MLLCIFAAVSSHAQTTVSFQAPEVTTPGFDGTWIDGFSGGAAVYGANNQIRAGRNGSGVNGVARGLVRFDPDTLFGRYSAVTAVTLELTTAGYSTSTTGGTLELYALPSGDSGWSAAQSTKSQKNKSYAYSWASASADANGFKTLPAGSVLATATYAANQASGQKITFTFTGNSTALTTLLDDMIESRCGGFLLKAQDESVTASDVYFYSAANATLGNRPKLTVTYTPGYKVMGTTEADAFLARQRSYFGSTWDTSVTPNRVKEGDGSYEMDRNARYAHALLDTGVAANFTTAEGLINYIRSQQILSPGVKSEHGHIRYKNTSASAAASNPVLHDFCTLTLLSIKLLHYSKLSSAAKADLDAMLPLAVTWTRENRGMGVVGITNQEAASWAVLLLGGQAYADSAATSAGTNFWGQTWTYVANTNNAVTGSPNIIEFVSPTYQFVTLENLALLKRYLTGNATILAQARTYYGWIWDEMARHYHAPSKLITGPNTRSYSDLNGAIGGTDYSVAYGIGGFKNGAFAYPFSSTLGPHTARTPAEFLPFFNDALPAARTDTDTFYHGPTTPSSGDNVSIAISNHGVVPIIGRTYLHPSYAAASLNFSKSGQFSYGTKRPVLVTWGDGSAGNAIALSLQTVMNTGDAGATLKETSRPVIFSSQEDGTSNILAGVTWSQNLNDPQVDWTNPTSSTFTASDLRIRIAAVRGSGTPPSVTLPANLTDPVAITFGGVTTTVKLASQDFPGFTPVWQTSTSGSARYLDLVIYSGTQQTFNLAALARFSAALALTTGTSGLVNQTVTTNAGTGTSSIACGANLLLYPTRPDTIHGLARTYRDLSSQTPLGAPLNLAASTPSAPAVALTWTDRANAETGFLVERRTAGSATWTALATLAPDTTTHTDSTAAAATEYEYRVHTLTTGNAIAATSTSITLITPGTFTSTAGITHTQAAGGNASLTFTLNNVSASAQTFTLSVPGGGTTYNLTRSGQSGGPTYGWIDIGPSSGSPGTKLTFAQASSFSASDEGRATFNLPAGFSFPYFGTTFAAGSPLYVSTNGFLAFTSFTGNTYSLADLATSGTGVANMIAPFWRDLDGDANTWIGWKQIDAATLVVSFINVKDFSGGGTNSFQVVLKSDGSLSFQYQTISTTGYGYSIGLKNADRTQGLSAGFSTANIGIPAAGSTLRFTPPASWLSSVSPTSVTVPAFSSTTITVNLNLAGLTNGQTYTSQISISSDLARQPAFTIPVQLTVGTPSSPASSPTLSPPAGTYTSYPTISLTSATPDAAIRYTTDGSTPTASTGTVYSTPFTLTSSATVTAIATKSGFADSAVASAAYVLNLPAAATPVIAPNGGTTSGPQTVALATSTANATIRYTTDGSTPTATIGTIYTGPFAQNFSGTVKAVASASGFTTSAVASADFTISGTTVNTPTLVESFAYSIGSLVAQNGGTGFVGAYPATGALSVIPALASPATAFTYAATGNAAQFASGNFTRALAAQNQINFAADGTRFFSFLFRGAPASGTLPSTILQWTAFTGNSGTIANPTETAAIRDANLQASSATLSRGSGFNAPGNGAYQWWGTNMFGKQGGQSANLAAAVSGNVYAAFTVSPASGYAVSISSVNGFSYSQISPDSHTIELLYSTDNFATSTSLGSRAIPGSDATALTFDTSAVAALQNATGPIQFRFYFHSESGNNVIRGLGGSPATATPALRVVGTVTPHPAPASSGNIGLKDASGNRVNLFGLDPDTVPASPAFTVGASGAGLTPGNATASGANGTTTYFVVGRITTSASGQDRVDYKVYSGAAALDAATPSTWTNGVAFSAGTTFDQLEFVNSVQVDEIRFGADWQSVTNQITPPNQAPVPLITPASGTYDPSVLVTITAPAGSTIRYTTDGSTPTAATGTVYSAPFPLTTSATVKAITTVPGLTPSNVASATYTLPVTLTPIEAWFEANSLPTNTSLTADSDSDGIPNLLEYALGGLPNSSASRPGVESQISNSNLQISFTPQVVSGLTYIIEASNDLSDWTDQTDVTALLTLGEPFTFTDVAPLGTTPRRFLRLKVVTP